MPFVLDASVAACWAFDDEDYNTAELPLERVRTDEARVPSLWWFEVRNTLYRLRAPGTPDGERHCDISARACATASQG